MSRAYKKGDGCNIEFITVKNILERIYRVDTEGRANEPETSFRTASQGKNYSNYELSTLDVPRIHGKTRAATEKIGTELESTFHMPC